MKRSIFPLLLALVVTLGGASAQTRELFPYITVPHYISAEGHKTAEWFTLHFWDNYDFSAAESRYAPEANKRGFMEFVHALYSTSPEHSARAIEEMMHKASTSEDGYWYFLEMAEVVLYDPSSPMRNDLLWEMFLRHATGIQSPLDDASKVRYRSLLQLVSRNQQGALATDFIYTLPNGRQSRLYAIDAPFTLIWFYNAGCSECARTKAQIEATGYLEALHRRGLLEVLALYPDGDVEAWRRHLSENPEWWITAYDKGEQIHRGELYDLKAIPTIYLLNSEKRVMMKDPTVEDLLGVLAQLLSNS